MPLPSKRKAIKKRYCELTDEGSDSNESEEHIVIPNPDESGSDGESSSNSDISGLSDDDKSSSEICLPNVSYRSIFDSYTEKQKLLEPNHTFLWCEGEKVYPAGLTDQLLLTDAVKRKISSMSHVELFELFFSEGIKNYIIEASDENDLELSVKELNTFIVIHLSKYGLRSTGTVRKDRVKQKHDFEKKAPRGTNKVSYDRNSGMNLISVIDSKEVSVLSTAAGVTSFIPMERYSRTAGKRTKLEFPCAFSLYNKYMGGVDLHDFRCKKASPSITSKKCPFKIFLRIIEMSITNSVTIRNICKKEDEKVMKTSDMCKQNKEPMYKRRMSSKDY
ncbi:hypothetical protein TSAR_007470 [Trichomalopsis sarcophagae]|uniref:PiggyBac transposable element-derived protein domain-containing protein n=1 Tax=Trichomalopsis sarcophagae TaxID=543379 RepID=A0A232ED74_9HYME|nr:hypothetical protein TSAR_007470 [Trichomalopsis sarcophagae]